MGFYLFDSHEVGPAGKLGMVQAIPGVIEAEHTPLSFNWKRKLDAYPVCWVQNEVYEAVAIAYDAKELTRFATGMVGRPHKWFFVPTEELVKLRPHLVEYLRGERSWRE